MSISGSQQKIIQDFCNSEPKTVKQIAEKLKLTGKNAIKSLYNFLKTQKANIIFFIETNGGNIWVRTNPLYFFDKSTRLDTVISKTEKKPESKLKTGSGKKHAKIEGLNRASPERLEAILKMNRIYKFGDYNKDLKQFEYKTEAKNEIDSLFRDYCFRVKTEKIIMVRAPDGNPVFSSEIAVNYKTRFTSQERQQENIEGFKRAYRSILKRHMKGVFLTLTAPSDGSKTLWRVNKDMLTAWDKFRVFLNKILPGRAEWLCVREFQQNGRLHFHIIIGGVNWLATKKLIQYTWKKYGGGEILDIHSIRNEPGRGWLWARSCPLEAAGDQPGNMLEKYLEKSMSTEGGSLYWVTGCRNWTCSKSLLPEKLEKEPVKSPQKKYSLKGIASAITGFRASHRKDSLALFSGSLGGSRKKSIDKPKEEKIKEPTLSLGFRRASDLSYQC